MAHVVVFAGDYDLANGPALQRAMRPLETTADLVLDLTEVRYIDFGFIAELVLLENARQARQFEPATIVTSVDSIVRRVAEACGKTATLGLVESYEPKHGDFRSVVFIREGPPGKRPKDDH